MLLTIVIPTKDRSLYLIQVLDSLSLSLKDVNFSYEILVVDDSSKNINLKKNRTIVSQYHKTFYTQTRCESGASSARNLGIRKSKGYWIAFIDDDVKVSVDWAKNLSIQIGRADEKLLGIEGAVIPSGSGLWDDDIKNISGKLYLTANIIYRRKTLEEVGGFNPNIKYWAEDHELASKILKIGKIKFFKEISVTHAPRKIDHWGYMLSTFNRISNYCDSEFLFFINSRNEYSKFRYAGNFWGTMLNFMTKNFYLKLKKREISQIIRNPFDTIFFVVVSILEQFATALFFPKYIILNSIQKMYRSKNKKQSVWLAANIRRDSYGGVGRVMHELSQSFKEKDYNVKLIYSDLFITRNYLIFSVLLFIKFFISTNKPDVVIARSTDILFLSIAKKVLNLKVKTVLHSHGWEEQVHELERKLGNIPSENKTKIFSHIIRFPMLRLALKLSDCIAIGTVDGLRYLQNRYPLYSNKLLFLPNGLAKGIVSDKFEKDENLFITVANTSWKKDLWSTIEIFKELYKINSNYKLICIGTGMSDLDFKEKFKIDNFNISNIKNIDFKSIKEVYKKASYIIVSSLYEGGHSLALLEAMANEIIPFVSPIKSNTEIIYDGVNGFILRESSAKLSATFINKIISEQIIDKSRVSHVCRSRRWGRNIERMESFLCMKK